MRNLQQLISGFVRDDDGSEVIEYALVIALVVIGLVLALGNSTTLSAAFDALFLHVANCIAPAAATTC